MPGSPRVSVVMAARDSAPWIAAAIESVLGQSLRDLELIVVDDGSRDETRAIAQSYGDPRMRVLAEEPRGAAASRNLGVESSRASYVAFIDADDIWLPGKLARQVAMLDADAGIDLGFTGVRLANALGHPMRMVLRPPRRALSFRDILARNLAITASCLITRRSVLDAICGFDPTLTSCIDYDLLLRIALLRNSNLRGVPEPLVLWRRRPGQITSDWRRMEAGYETVVRKILLVAPGARGVLSRSRSSHVRFLAYVALESGALSEAAHLIARSITCWPLSVVREPFLAVLAAQLALASGRRAFRRLKRAATRSDVAAGQEKGATR